MKNIIYNYIFVVILIFVCINIVYYLEERKEAFTPAIRELYRPYVRNVRILSEGFYNRSSSNILNLFRKYGIL
jgi:hypothetical protein